VTHGVGIGKMLTIEVVNPNLYGEPASLMYSPWKLAVPETMLIVVSDLGRRIPAVGFNTMEAVTVPELTLVMELPPQSWMESDGCVPNTEPPVTAPRYVLNANLYGEPTDTVKELERTYAILFFEESRAVNCST
jgi:hypothetical protein